MNDYPDGEGRKQKVYLVPEWAALGALDKNFLTTLSVDATTWETMTSYLVPVGKTLYITQFGGTIELAGGNVHIYLRTNDGVGNTELTACTGGVSGNALSLNKPVVIPAGYYFETLVFNPNASASTIRTFAGGYEL
jgi:hypothetical protein